MLQRKLMTNSTRELKDDPSAFIWPTRVIRQRLSFVIWMYALPLISSTSFQASHVGKLVHVPGIVISASKAHPQVSSVTIRCSKCNYRDVLKSNGSQPVAIPRYCTYVPLASCTIQIGDWDRKAKKTLVEWIPSRFFLTNANMKTPSPSSFRNVLRTWPPVRCQDTSSVVWVGMSFLLSLCLSTLVDRVSPGTRVSLIAFVDLFEASKKVCPLIPCLFLATDQYSCYPNFLSASAGHSGRFGRRWSSPTVLHCRRGRRVHSSLKDEEHLWASFQLHCSCHFWWLHRRYYLFFLVDV